MITIIIAINQTAGNIFIEDIGATIPASSQATLTDGYFVAEIQASRDLRTEIESDNILLNDGIRDMTKNESLNMVTTIATEDATPAVIKVRVATTANGTLATDFENGDAIDGITLATDDKILLKNQTTASENGVYAVQVSGAPVRTSDLLAGSNAASAIVSISEGDTNRASFFFCTNTFGSDVVGTDSLTFEAQTASAGASVGQVWEFDSATGDADPGAGDFRLNNATQSSATQVFVADESKPGVDFSNFLNSLEDNDRLYIQEEEDASRFHLFRVTGDAVDATGYVKIPVVSESSGTNDLRAGKECGLLFLFSGTGSGGITAAEGSDGYVSFFTGANSIAGDNDLFWDRATNRLGIHEASPNEFLTVGSTNAAISLREATAPSSAANYGKIYAHSSDGYLHFVNSAGDDIQMSGGTGGGGSGDVTGPASSTDNAIARFDSTTGKIIQDSSVTIDDDGYMAGAGRFTYDQELDNGSRGGTYTLNWTNQKQAITLTSDLTLSFTNPPGAGHFTLRVAQDSTGGWTIIWPASAKWRRGIAPNFSFQSGNVENIITFYFNGSNYYGAVLKDFS